MLRGLPILVLLWAWPLAAGATRPNTGLNLFPNGQLLDTKDAPFLFPSRFRVGYLEGQALVLRGQGHGNAFLIRSTSGRRVSIISDPIPIRPGREYRFTVYGRWSENPHRSRVMGEVILYQNKGGQRVATIRKVKLRVSYPDTEWKRISEDFTAEGDALEVFLSVWPGSVCFSRFELVERGE